MTYAPDHPYAGGVYGGTVVTLPDPELPPPGDPPPPPPPPPTPPEPPAWQPALLVWLQQLLDPPTLGELGRPDDWQATTVLEDFGTILVTVGGVDITLFRGVPAQIVEWTEADPYTDERLVLRLPAVSIFEPRGEGDLGWLTRSANVELWRLTADHEVDPVPLFEGMIDARADRTTETSGGLELDCIGALHQNADFVRAPGITDRQADIGTLCAAQWNLEARPALRTDYMPLVVTGVTTRYRGSGETALDFQRRLLSFAVEETGDRWTISKHPGRVPVLHKVDTTTVHHVITAGGRGVELDLREDEGLDPNVWYAEGEDSGGLRHRGMHVPGSGGHVTPFFQPAAYHPDVHTRDEDGMGGLVDHPERLDKNRRRIEAWVNMGQGISRPEAQSLLGPLVRDDVPLVGTITLRSGTEQGHQLTVKAGQNIQVRYVHGISPILHVGRVERTVTDGNVHVTLTVDQAFRDIETVQAILEGRRQDAVNPIRSILVGRSSTQQKDSQVPWDARAGSGVVPRSRFWSPSDTVELEAGTWHIERAVASERDTIIDTRFQTSPAKPFHVSFYDRSVGLAELPADPFDEEAWDEMPPGFIRGYGALYMAAGYAPGQQVDGDPVTGWLIDQTSWQYSHDSVPELEREPQFLWVAMWCPEATTIWGTFKRGVGT